MPVRNPIKADALARIERGPAFVRHVETAHYHVGVIGLGEHADGVWLELSSEKWYAVANYRSAALRLDGHSYPLSKRDADHFARIVAKAMRRRLLPVVWPRLRRRARSKSSSR